MNLRHMKAGSQCQNQLQFYNSAKLCNYLKPQRSCWICRGKFSINLHTQNKQTKSALHFHINTAQDSARSELLSAFRSASAVLVASQINKNIFVVLRSLCPPSTTVTRGDHDQQGSWEDSLIVKIFAA